MRQAMVVLKAAKGPDIQSATIVSVANLSDSEHNAGNPDP